MIIRPVETEDLPALRDALVAAWHATYDDLIGARQVTAITENWHSPSALAREQAMGDGSFLLGEIDGRIVAAALAAPTGDGWIYLSRLYLVPDIQGRGLGARLLQEVLAPFDRAPVRLEVHPGNDRALRFYRRQGFLFEEGGERDPTRIVMMRPALFPPRDVRDEDSQDLFGLLTLCFAEYPGCFADPHDDLSDLREPARSAEKRGARFFVVEDRRGRICACASVDFPARDTAELHRLYVRPDARRGGLGTGLVRLVEALAEEMGARRVVFWSDTRFTQAHRLYARLGYARGPTTRALGDVSDSTEYYFEKALL